MVKTGPGVALFTGANTYSRGTTISQGTLAVAFSSTPLGSGTVNLAGGRLQLLGSSSIAVHFGTDQNSGESALPAAVSAGVIPVSNWNNAPGQSGSTTNITGPIAGSLAANVGGASGVTIAWASGGGTYNFAAPAARLAVPATIS